LSLRFGGEEFAAILPFTTDSHEALAIAERMKACVRKIAVRGPPITISAGLALCCHSAHTSYSLVEAADQALYRAKRAGKDRVVLSDL